MAIASIGGLGATGNDVSSTTLVLTTTAQLEAGNVGILNISCDNTGTTDADFSEVSGVVDSAGNTYTKLKEFTNGQGAAGAGVTSSLWMVRATTNLASAGTVTITFANTVVAKCCTFWEFTVDASLAVAGSNQNATDAANGWGSLTISGLVSEEYLFYRGLAKNTGSTGTQITPTANYAATGNFRSGTNATTSVLIRGEYRIVTATSGTSNPTLNQSADNASVFVALHEFRPELLGTPDGSLGQRQMAQLLAQ